MRQTLDPSSSTIFPNIFTIFLFNSCYNTLFYNIYMSRNQFREGVNRGDKKTHIQAFTSKGQDHPEGKNSALMQFKVRSQLKTQDSLKHLYEKDEKNHFIHLTCTQNGNNIQLSQKKSPIYDTPRSFFDGKMNHINRLPQLKCSNFLQFSFQQKQNNIFDTFNSQQNISIGKKSLLQRIRYKATLLNIEKSILYDQYINLKKQFIKFERNKKFLFEDFEKIISKQFVEVVKKEIKEKERLIQLLQSTKKELQKSQNLRNQFQLQNENLQQDLVKSQKTANRLKEEMQKMKEQMDILLAQNEDYFNQNSELQGTILKLSESASERESIQRELSRSKSYIRQLQSKKDQKTDELWEFEEEVMEHRIGIQLKIKQGWIDFSQAYDQLMPIASTIKESFSKLEEYKKKRVELRHLKQITEEKIGFLMEYQKQNYIQLNELERDDARYKLYSLVNMMVDIKNSIFDSVDQSKNLFKSDQNCGKSVGALIQQCNKSLQSLNYCRSNKNLLSSPQKQGGWSFPRQMSQRFLKQSVATMGTSESRGYRGLANSYSESKILMDDCSLFQHSRKSECSNRLSGIKERIQVLRQKVRQNLEAIC